MRAGKRAYRAGEALMDGRTIEPNGGLNAIDVVCINCVLLKIFEVEPVAKWPWWIVVSPYLIYYAGLLAILAVLAVYAKTRKRGRGLP